MRWILYAYDKSKVRNFDTYRKVRYMQHSLRRVTMSETPADAILKKTKKDTRPFLHFQQPSNRAKACLVRLILWGTGPGTTPVSFGQTRVWVYSGVPGRVLPLFVLFQLGYGYIPGYYPVCFSHARVLPGRVLPLFVLVKLGYGYIPGYYPVWFSHARVYTRVLPLFV